MDTSVWVSANIHGRHPYTLLINVGWYAMIQYGYWYDGTHPYRLINVRTLVPRSPNNCVHAEYYVILASGS